MKDINKLQEIINDNVTNSQRYIEDGFNLYNSKNTQKLLDSLQYSPTDMGEERTLDDLKKYHPKHMTIKNYLRDMPTHALRPLPTRS